MTYLKKMIKILCTGIETIQYATFGTITRRETSKAQLFFVKRFVIFEKSIACIFLLSV